MDEIFDENIDEYKTSDMNLGAFLLAKGIKMVRIDNDSKRKSFVFNRDSHLKDLVEIFYYSEPEDEQARVDARLILNSLKELKTKLYNLV